MVMIRLTPKARDKNGTLTSLLAMLFPASAAKCVALRRIDRYEPSIIPVLK
jgi:hypothetical protein